MNVRSLRHQLVVLLVLVSAQYAAAQKKPNIVILATGGTIAGAAATGTQAGYTSGAVTIEWTTDPARGRDADTKVRAEDVHVRLPVDWDSVDPIPPALAELMARPSEVNPPLDDVVPGEPEPASSVSA